MLTLQELSDLVGGRLTGDPTVEIHGVASLESARPDQIAPFDNPAYARVAARSRAGALLVSDRIADPPDLPHVVSKYPLASLNRVMEALGLVAPPLPPGIHPTAIVDRTAQLGPDVHVGPYVVIGARARIGARTLLMPGAYVDRNVVVGKDCVLEPNAVLHEGALLGDRVVVGAHAVVARQGFGYAPGPEGPVKLRHIGRVVLEDDVHLGAGAMVDRARFDETRIGRHSKLDNLVHVGHNCTIGERSFFAAQTGLAGNARIGDDCEIGGQVGIANRSGCGDGVRVGAQAGVIRMLGDGGEYWGTPAMPKREFLKQMARLRRMVRSAP